MEIKNIKVYGLESSIIRSGYPMQVGEPEDLVEHYMQRQMFPSANNKDRAFKLANTPNGSGHNNFLKGIIVQFDLKYPQYFTPQLQRYHWIDIISSQSKMHKLTSVDNIIHSSNDFVLCSIANEVNSLIRIYNKETFPFTYVDNSGEKSIIESKEECFQYIISNLPMGYELWMGISTNYLQLSTIYQQRKTHKLKHDWGYFCNWIKTLPLSELITKEFLENAKSKN